MTEQSIQQALTETAATMARQRLLKQLWKLRKASAEASSDAARKSASETLHQGGHQRQSA